MSAERLQQSLRRLHVTADALEAGVAASEPTLRAIDPAVAILPPAPAVSRPRSTARVVCVTLMQSAASVAVLALLCAAGDPLVPRPAGPSLAAAAEVEVGSSVGSPAIPQIATNRP